MNTEQKYGLIFIALFLLSALYLSHSHFSPSMGAIYIDNWADPHLIDPSRKYIDPDGILRYIP